MTILMLALFSMAKRMLPVPITILKAPLGSPTAARVSARMSEEIGVVLAGLSTMVLPVAIAGSTLWATRFTESSKG